MQREIFEPRINWKQRCEDSGFHFHTIKGEPYWQEEVGYKFTSSEVDLIDDATAELHLMCMDFVDKIVAAGNYDDYLFPEWVISLIESSWKSKQPHVYGRFDLAYNNGQIKMLEYNADTPTSLLESSIIQWFWLEDRNLPDQFNSIHEKLIDRWKEISEKLPLSARLYLTTMSDAGTEDWSNLSYIAETVVQAGLDCSLINIEEIGWDKSNRVFCDINDEIIHACFKLYPWEWLVQDDFGENIIQANTMFIEPAWKMLLSNKALLPLLWKQYENHPLLLPAYFEKEKNAVTQKGKWVRKPMLAREGSNVSLLEDGVLKSLSGTIYNPAYDRDYVLQKWFNLPTFDGWNAVIGSWVVGEEPAGMGIREDKNTVTGNASSFVSHYFEEE